MIWSDGRRGAPAGRLNAVRILTIGYALVWIVVRTSHWRDLSRLPSSRWEPVGVMTWLGSRARVWSRSSCC